jgi:hypothetical protein
MNLNTTLATVPDALKKPLIEEYNNIIQNYLERRWTSSELSGGRFCEIVFSILDGHAKGIYALAPFKPSNFVDSCKKLESNAHVPRSFQILIPRMLPSLYEIRNNRNVGHVGGDVDSNHMDALAVVSMSGWILGELIRVFHNVSIAEAQKIVDFVTNRKIPLVWESGQMKRILNPSLSLKDQILLLTGSQSSKTNVTDLQSWIEYKDKAYFIKTLRQLHKARLVNLTQDESELEILPPGTQHLEKLISKLK